MRLRHIPRSTDPIKPSDIPDKYPTRHSQDIAQSAGSPRREPITARSETLDWERDDQVALVLKRAINTVRQERNAMLQRFSKINEEIETLREKYDD